ncbi:hypothetical protein D5E72_24285 [Vibrio parahaemolyticus]|nr:hypothetical protein D5E73_24370 [Vibrio parahaemolyticus]TBT71313.1 hypothetical protein D5E72_24285 [Vibrio parahaemolyticus]
MHIKVIGIFYFNRKCTVSIIFSHSFSEASFSYNAALRREQRNTQQLPHCTLNTKLDANQKCYAL